VNREGAEVTSAGRAFQTRAPATEKCIKPTISSAVSYQLNLVNSKQFLDFSEVVYERSDVDTGVTAVSVRAVSTNEVTWSFYFVIFHSSVISIVCKQLWTDFLKLWGQSSLWIFGVIIIRMLCGYMLVVTLSQHCVAGVDQDRAIHWPVSADLQWQ